MCVGLKIKGMAADRWEGGGGGEKDEGEEMDEREEMDEKEGIDEREEMARRMSGRRRNGWWINVGCRVLTHKEVMTGRATGEGVKVSTTKG